MLDLIKRISVYTAEHAMKTKLLGLHCFMA